MSYRVALILLGFLLLSACASSSDPPGGPTTRPAANALTPAERKQRIDAAIERGVAFLLRTQNPDGSWGTGKVTRGFEIYSMVPGSIETFKVATTALCVMALREVGETSAHDKGVEFLLTKSHVARDDGDMIYNTWAHIYTVEALAIEMRHNKDPRIPQTIAWHIDRLGRYECFVGGWNYYDFHVGTQHPASGGTSFGTAAGLGALWEARQSGCEVPQKLIDRAIKVLDACRLPNGAYLYGWDYRYIPRLDANQVRGSIGRAQSGNFALWLWNAGVGEKDALAGLRQFEKDHIFIEMGRQRQFPHEAWYQTAPYYYYFGHYYAARLVERLKEPDRAHFQAALADWLLPIQGEDGSWWDYAMWDFHKPYGTAYAVMTLLRCK